MKESLKVDFMISLIDKLTPIYEDWAIVNRKPFNDLLDFVKEIKRNKKNLHKEKLSVGNETSVDKS